jgi:hypothetical protein
MVLFSAGCFRLQSWQTSATATGPENAYGDQYGLGVNAYFVADYQVAAEAFLSVVQQASDPVLARKALYGLACARFMLTDTEDELHLAMASWQAWLKAAPRNWDLENPILLDPIVHKKFNVPHRDRNTVQHEVEESDAPSATWSDIRLRYELDKLKSQLKAARQKALEHQDTMRALEKENAKLKEQIRAIELIDRKIQEKKTAVPTNE